MPGANRLTPFTVGRYQVDEFGKMSTRTRIRFEATPEELMTLLASYIEERAREKVGQIVREAAEEVAEKTKRGQLEFKRALAKVLDDVEEFCEGHEKVSAVYLGAGDRALRLLVVGTDSTFDFSLAEAAAELEYHLFRKHDGFPATCVHVPACDPENLAAFTGAAEAGEDG